MTFVRSETQVAVSGSPGFVLVKASWFPYWRLQTEGVHLMRTTQGFMLIYSPGESFTLTYEEPLTRHVGLALAALGLLGLAAYTYRYAR